MHYTPTTNPNPAYGESGPSVASLQTSLNQKLQGTAGFTPLAVDSKYGPLTKAAYDMANKPASTDANLLPRVAPSSAPAQTASPTLTQPTPENSTTPKTDPYTDLINTAKASLLATTNAYSDNLKYAVGETPGVGGTPNEAATIQNARANADANRASAITNETQNIANLTAADQSQAAASIKTLAENHMDWSSFKTQDPVSYNKLVQATGGDPNITDAMFATSIPPQNIQQTWITGSTYNQLVTDPITGKPSVQSYDLGVTLPQSWTQEKIGTNAVIYHAANWNPNDPTTYQIFGVNPLTGIPTAQIGGAPNPTAQQGTASSATPNYVSILSKQGINVNPSDSLATFISDPNNLNALVQAAIQNEGGTPQGTNNPGNVKFANQPGATIGKAASDGGNFANFATPQDGLNAIAQTYQNLAKQGLSVGDAIQKYTNTGPTDSQTTTDTSQYGLLAKVPGFNPQGADGVDRAAANYLRQFLTQGKIPTASSLGISTRGQGGGLINSIADKSGQYYKEATGHDLPNADIQAANLSLITDNNKLLNNLNLQTGTIGSNIKLLQKNIQNNDVNTSAPAINKIVNALASASGSPSVAQYLAQNETIKNELASLLSIKNASGTTVADKLSATDVLPSGATSDQISSIVNTLLKEAQNQASSIATQNAQLYIKTDELGMNPDNPVNQTINLVDPDGNVYTVQPGTYTPDQLSQAFDQGYTIEASQ